MHRKTLTIKYNIRRIARLLFLAGWVFLSGKFLGCEPEDWILDVNCNDCFSEEPDSANLIVKLTINGEYDSVPLTFYRGPAEKREIDWQDTATEEEFYLFSAVDQEYAVKAEYRSGTSVIVAFDEDVMRVTTAEEECGYPCYYVKGGILDLRLIE